ncbi:MAG TPA: DUF6159 family protein, partial [Solirubrobacterales bacterium]|nr:DUF6159 family protein [Solirubrobacterales bacterium]
IFSLAVACAVDMGIDGVGGELRMVLGEMRRRLPALLWWWLISMGVSVALSLGAKAVTRPGLAALGVAVLWGVGSLFVVPAMALQEGGPLEALGEALRLLRARWRWALVGVLVIGFFFGLACIACGFLLRATVAGDPRGAGESLWRIAGPLALVYVAYAWMNATREGFAVILARDVLGDLPGEPPIPKPRRRSSTIFRRVVIGALALMVGLLVLGAILGRHRSDSRPSAGANDARAMGPANRPLPPGEWEATGVKLTGVPGYTNEPAGTVLYRPWTFVKDCRHSCRIFFFRQTLYGPSVTKLVQIGRNRYVANFPGVRVPCAYQGTYTGPRRSFGRSHDRYRLYGRLSGNELHATEWQSESGCYPGEPEPPDVTKWRAIRSDRGRSQSAAIGREPASGPARKDQAGRI